MENRFETVSNGCLEVLSFPSNTFLHPSSQIFAISGEGSHRKGESNESLLHISPLKECVETV